MWLVLAEPSGLLFKLTELGKYLSNLPMRFPVKQQYWHYYDILWSLIYLFKTIWWLDSLICLSCRPFLTEGVALGCCGFMQRGKTAPTLSENVTEVLTWTSVYLERPGISSHYFFLDLGRGAGPFVCWKDGLFLSSCFNFGPHLVVLRTCSCFCVQRSLLVVLWLHSLIFLNAYISSCYSESWSQ